MIVSYVSQPEPELRLSVVGTLDDAAVQTLEEELGLRREPWLRACVIDLTQATPAARKTPESWMRLRKLAEQRGIALTVSGMSGRHASRA